MGSLLTPRRLLSRQFAAHCEALSLRPADFIAMARTLFPSASRPRDEDPGQRQGNLRFLKLELRLGLEQVITLLAMDFGVTRRFIEVRLNKYGLLPQEQPVL
jgi:hypothetical protein